MNWRRGFIRVWIIASVAWIVFGLWLEDVPCLVGFTYEGTKPWCGDPLVYPWTVGVQTLDTLLSVPIIALALGCIVGWISRGFRAN